MIEECFGWANRISRRKIEQLWISDSQGRGRRFKRSISILVLLIDWYSSGHTFQEVDLFITIIKRQQPTNIHLRRRVMWRQAASSSCRKSNRCWNRMSLRQVQYAKRSNFVFPASNGVIWRQIEVPFVNYLNFDAIWRQRTPYDAYFCINSIPLRQMTQKVVAVWRQNTPIFFESFNGVSHTSSDWQCPLGGWFLSMWAATADTTWFSLSSLLLFVPFASSSQLWS